MTLKELREIINNLNYNESIQVYINDIPHTHIRTVKYINYKWKNDEYIVIIPASGYEILFTTGASGGSPGGGCTTENSREEDGSLTSFEMPRLFVATMYML